MKKEETALNNNTLPDNVIDLQTKDVNINIDGDVVSLIDLEKMFFLSKLNNDPAFIASILKINVQKIDKIINSCKFQEIVNEYLSEYMAGKAGEQPEQLTLRYKEFLQECFTSLRISIGMKIRKSIEDDKPLDGKFLNINLVEKIMRLEFALHGLPIDIKGYLHATKKEAKDKTEQELIDSVQGIKETIERATNNKFNPLNFKEEQEVIEGAVVESTGDDTNSNSDDGE
jgi:hypothetical protein